MVTFSKRASGAEEHRPPEAAALLLNVFGPTYANGELHGIPASCMGVQREYELCDEPLDSACAITAMMYRESGMRGAAGLYAAASGSVRRASPVLPSSCFRAQHFSAGRRYACPEGPAGVSSTETIDDATLAAFGKYVAPACSWQAPRHAALGTASSTAEGVLHSQPNPARVMRP